MKTQAAASRPVVEEDMTRDQTTVNAGGSTVLLQDNVIRRIDAANAKGTDQQPGRSIEYQADQVRGIRLRS